MKLKVLLTIVLLFLVTGYTCHRRSRTTTSTASCKASGGYGVFVAKFDQDVVGSIPSSSHPSGFGPAGAALNIVGVPNSIEVINSVPLGSQALRIFRDFHLNIPSTDIDCLPGDGPHTSGVIDMHYKVYAEESSDAKVANMTTAARSADGTGLLFLHFFGGSYQLEHRDGLDDLPGTFSVNTVHKIHIKMNLSTRKFSVCINDQLLASNKTLLGDEFDGLHLLRFSLISHQQETIPASYVLDEIRIIK